MKVAILGCGPAGLLAAHAVAQKGAAPKIFSIKRQSPIGGAQYLHRPIPGVASESPDGKIDFVKYGDPRVYAQKVYGDPDAVTSWFKFNEGMHEVWNLRAAYDRLWKLYEGAINDCVLNTEVIEQIRREHDLVMSTIPRNLLCHSSEHNFSSQDVYIEYGPVPDVKENKIVYDGTYDADWYRYSTIFGWAGTEWRDKPTGVETALIRKPLYTDCNCMPDILKLGRYGEWKKGILTHDAYEGAVFRMAQVR